MQQAADEITLRALLMLLPLVLIQFTTKSARRGYFGNGSNFCYTVKLIAENEHFGNSENLVLLASTTMYLKPPYVSSFQDDLAEALTFDRRRQALSCVVRRPFHLMAGTNGLIRSPQRRESKSVSYYRALV